MDPATLPLRDIHLPGPVSWWPPAPGWWLLGALVLALVLLLSWGWSRLRRRRRSVAWLCRPELRRLRQEYEGSTDATGLARDLSVLVRQICISGFPRWQVAGLTGEAWLEFLDGTAGHKGFSQGPGRALVEAPYRPHSEFEAQALLDLVESWAMALNQAAGERRT